MCAVAVCDARRVASLLIVDVYVYFPLFFPLTLFCTVSFVVLCGGDGGGDDGISLTSHIYPAKCGIISRRV